MPLFARSYPGLTVLPLDPSRPYGGRIDAHATFQGLAAHLRRDWQAFPRRDRGYLATDPDRAGALRQRLADGRKVIGLSWISRNQTAGRSKSARLRDLEALLRLPGCRFVDLQYGDTQAEREAVEREPVSRSSASADIDNTRRYRRLGRAGVGLRCGGFRK